MNAAVEQSQSGSSQQSAEIQDMRDDLDKHKNLKLELATHFGKPRAFFDCLGTPGSEGHGKVYQFVKRLYSQVESLRILKVAANSSGNGSTKQSLTAASKKGSKGGAAVNNRRRMAAQEAEGGTGGIRQRSSDPTPFDNDQYMAELEANLLRAMNIQPEETPPAKVFSSNRSGSRNTSGTRINSSSRPLTKNSSSKTRATREDSPSKLQAISKTRQPMAARNPQGQKTMMARKYSDNRYDKPEMEARIEAQTIKALETMGLAAQIDSNQSS